MRVLMVASLVVLSFGWALVGREAAYARTRTPTPTPTPTSTPPATATPVPPQPAVFHLIPWVNGRDDTARNVTANIGETLCATGDAVFPTGSRPRAVFQLRVPSEEAVPGCGREGAVVTFFVDGRQAPQTAVWHSGISQSLNVIIGPPFARFTGVVYTNLRLGNETVVPYVGDESCGDKAPSYWIGIGPYYDYGAIVYSREQQAGCGVEGSQITFKLLDAQGNVVAIARETGIWHAWDGESYATAQRLNLTFEPAGFVTMPSTGTGDGPEQATAPWGPLALALASLGLTGGIAALALRRRAMTR